MSEKRFRYCVLYIRDTEHHKLTGILEKYMPSGRGQVFYPCMEYYRRDDKEVKVKAIFPGYVFLYTDLNIKEIHQLIDTHRGELNTAMRELTLAERRVTDPDFLSQNSTEDKLYELTDIDEEEESFIDTLREGNGLLAMSSGYEYVVKDRKEKKQKKYVVVEGPLKAYEDRIVIVDKHNRRAFLEFEINGRQAQAGFNCLPKAHWFPNKNSEIITFTDGTETDLGELKDKIMTLK
ncbi:MAG: hypothetical protein IJ682_01125 [Lachnospiraceae bacterium]|nr:hypothetical protein [Lachnospiraceae bacterium]